MVPPMRQEYANYSMQPQDDIAAIKMRNRRFAQDGGYQMGMPQQHMYPSPAPVWRGPVLQPPAMMPGGEMMGGLSDELRSIEEDLNLTRRATRPFLPGNDPAIFDLQKQISQLVKAPRKEVGIADQIAIRSFVLSKSLGKVGGAE